MLTVEGADCESARCWAEGRRNSRLGHQVVAQASQGSATRCGLLLSRSVRRRQVSSESGGWFSAFASWLASKAFCAASCS